MSKEWQEYIKDPRTVCRYGSECYQKNPDHHKNFKHPPINSKRKIANNSPVSKRFKPSPKPGHSPKKLENTKDEDHGKSEESTDESHNSPVSKRFKPSPKPRHSPKKLKNTKDEDHGKSEESTDESHNLKRDSTASPVKDEPNSAMIKLPEIITYHDKCDQTLFKELFLVEMPEDFFKFYECLQEEKDYITKLASVNLELVGPFDVLLGKMPILDDKELNLVHWRFFYDPPEFQTVLKKKGKSEYHIGYFRDDPSAAPVFLASNDSAKDCHITPMADNIFGAVYIYLENEKKSSPFTSIACHRMMEKVKKWADMHKYSLNEYDMKKRLLQSVTKTFHGAGIVVPYNKKTELGYRKLVETDANIKKIFTKLENTKDQAEKDKILSEIQPVITYASIAVDECDFGTGLECGIDLFCSGIKELEQSALSSLLAVYSLLNRDAFGKIFQAHIKYRRKGPNMSVLSAAKS